MENRFAFSVVTYNRKDMLRQVLEAIEKTCPEQHTVFVTDNNSQDGTPDMLKEMESEGKLKAYCLSENIGTAGGRNAHMKDMMGMDSVRIDDKVLLLYPGWLTALSLQSKRYHSILAVPYDPTVLYLNNFTPILDYIQWPQEAGMGGPLMFVPKEVTEALGGSDEMTDGEERCLYGWDDLLYIHRARLLGWNYGFTLRVPHKILAQASPERRNKALEFHPTYMQLWKKYQEADRDVFILLEETYGYRVGQQKRNTL